jgi:hypothetical protein
LRDTTFITGGREFFFASSAKCVVAYFTMY